MAVVALAKREKLGPAAVRVLGIEQVVEAAQEGGVLGGIGRGVGTGGDDAGEEAQRRGGAVVVDRGVVLAGAQIGDELAGGRAGEVGVLGPAARGHLVLEHGGDEGGGLGAGIPLGGLAEGLAPADLRVEGGA